MVQDSGWATTLIQYILFHHFDKVQTLPLNDVILQTQQGQL